MKYLKTFENFGAYPDVEFANQIVAEILPDLKRRKDNGETITLDSFEEEMKEKYPSAFQSKGGQPPMFDTMLHIIVDKGDDIGFEFDIETNSDFDGDDEMPPL